MQIDVDGHSIFATTGGRPFDAARPAIIFVHGAGNDHSVWQLPARYFAYHGHAVVAIDLPGHGRSEGSSLDTIAAMADWLGRFMDAAGIETASLVGHSMGGLVTLAAAAAMPERITALAMFGVAETIPVHPDLLAAAERDDHVAFELITSWGFSARSRIGGHRAPGVWMIGSGMRLLERIPDGVFARDLAACDAFSGAEDMASRIRCPTLLILGGRDLLTAVRGGEELAGKIAGARTVVFPECGHMMLTERPDESLDALRGFLP